MTKRAKFNCWYMCRNSLEFEAPYAHVTVAMGTGAMWSHVFVLLSISVCIRRLYCPDQRCKSRKLRPSYLFTLVYPEDNPKTHSLLLS